MLQTTNEETIEKVTIETNQATEDFQIDPTEIRKEVDDTLKHITALQSYITELQNRCRHTDTGVEGTNSSSTIELRIVCKICRKKIGYPTQKDLEDNGYR